MQLLQVPPNAQPVEEDVPAIFRQPTVEEERITMTFHKITENNGEDEKMSCFIMFDLFENHFGWNLDRTWMIFG